MKPIKCICGCGVTLLLDYDKDGDSMEIILTSKERPHKKQVMGVVVTKQQLEKLIREAI